MMPLPIFIRRLTPAATASWLMVAGFASAAPAPSPLALDQTLRPFLNRGASRKQFPINFCGDVDLDDREPSVANSNRADRLASC